ncbi:oligopeptide/dipeptide ABC transporter ATP-binding protein [Oscillibacter sp.]|uniref:ABC transporter ATP-binding protein n=1 Tax=Oscillibacter sp. TaxID=1945593 RepID=UPI001F8B09A7|nr:oligopeptide/dipeptide ABC transporter ATP-binding protein [Oscillibacter sp.]MBS6354478.1 ATP-binding cassette domain-containing protein [Oscillibacter sp.]HJB51969.1 ATP-binding cassette domain-containing protein [Candidatus Oscillibacter pullicola]
MADKDVILEVRDLKKYFKSPTGTLHAVDGVNFSIRRGETLGLVGESGCGKSTIGRLILGLHQATSGEILFNGQDICKMNKQQLHDLRKDLQIIFQDPFSSLNPRMSIGEIIGEPLRIHGKVHSRTELDKEVSRLMDVVGLSARLFNAYPHELDGGRRQRVGIARALSLKPQFIVCDEPVSSLDVSIQAQVLNLLKDLQAEFHLTYLFITHDLSVVKFFSDKIAVMYLGQLVETADSAELFRQPMHPYSQALLSAIPIPSSRQKMQRVKLIGELQSPIDPEPGCRFAKRCLYAQEGCTGRDLALRGFGNGHFCACCRAGALHEPSISE